MISERLARVPRFLLPAGLRRAVAAELGEQQLDVALAARRMARRRVELGREPFRAKARQLCEEKGLPIPPALLERPN